MRELDRQFRLLRQHGMSVSDTVRHEASEVTFEEYPVVGFNYRMTDIQGAIGREQVKTAAGAGVAAAWTGRPVSVWRSAPAPA